jgi:hypothetical protein
MKESLKLILATVALTLCAMLLVLLYLGGETLVQAGIRLTAVEEGFKLAGRHWQYDAFPSHEGPMQVAVVEKPAVKPVKKGGAHPK